MLDIAKEEDDVKVSLLSSADGLFSYRDKDRTFFLDPEARNKIIKGQLCPEEPNVKFSIKL